MSLRFQLRWHLALRTTLGTHCIVHLSCTAIVLASLTAVLAALWSAEVLGGVKLLFTVSERKYVTAIAAGKLLISHIEK